MRLAPVLPDFKDLPGRGPELAAPKDIGGAQEYSRALLGRESIGGRLPVSLPPHYPVGFGVRVEAVEAP